MKNTVKKKLRMTKTTTMHYVKLLFRSLLFICATVVYAVAKISGKSNALFNVENGFWGFGYNAWISGCIWVVFVVEMILRFIPSSIESPGSQKHFKRNYIEYKNATDAEKKQGNHGVLRGMSAWVTLNVIIIVLYFALRLDKEIMLLVALAYSVCDMICILFFCPFQTWFMKNRCCTVCRIYNWDFAMMFTPFFAVWGPYTTSLLAISLALLIQWEIIARRHPERFDESKNLKLSCGMCNEKLCHSKRQLQVFLAKNSENLLLKGNLIINREIERLRKRRQMHDLHIHIKNAKRQISEFDESVRHSEKLAENEIAESKTLSERPIEGRGDKENAD
ncbi:MAG: hypothetical protein ACI4M6_00540 [Christensenellaceae bacterium]